MVCAMGATRAWMKVGLRYSGEAERDFNWKLDWTELE